MTTTHQPRSPWVIDIQAWGLTHGRGPGRAHPLELAVPAGDDVTDGVLAVPEGATITVTGRVESVSEGVLVSADAAARAVGACARCLRDIELDLDVSLRELYAYPESLTARTTDADDVARITDDLIDLAPLVHDELVLAMPTVALCTPDCLGLCPDCGERLEDVGPDHHHETIDPRWAALAGLLQADSGEKTEEEHAGESGTSEEN